MMLKNGLVHPIMTKKINKKVIGMFKDELGGNIIKEFCAPRAKTYSFKIDDGNNTENKKAKGTKKCVIKSRLKFKDYYDSIFENKNILISQQWFTSDHRTICTEKINKIIIRNGKRLQTFDKVITYPHETSVFKVCESEMIASEKYLRDE